MPEIITINTLENELSNFYGSEQYYMAGPLFSNFMFTEGVQYLAERAGAYWLLDLIFSHQCNEQIRKAPFQIWTLRVNENQTAVVHCREDLDTTVITEQQIEFTDFPVGTIKLYFIENVLLLPSEY